MVNVTHELASEVSKHAAVARGLSDSGFTDVFFVPKFKGTGCALVDNLKSVNLNQSVSFQKIQKEVLEGRVAGSFSLPPLENFRLSPLGLMPKKEPNSYRLIHHLSSPRKASLNDSVDKTSASVEYASFDSALDLCLIG